MKRDIKQKVKEVWERNEKYLKIRDLVEQLLKTLGLDIKYEGLKDTPHRVAKMWVDELTKGLRPMDEGIARVFKNDKGYDQLITLKDIWFYSMCEHHLLPFFGKVYIGYLPEDKLIGLSKMARVVDYFASKPTIQERLTQEIADWLYDNLEPSGVIVVVRARHLCYEMRGVRKPGMLTQTSAIRGDIPKEEFFDIMKIDDKVSV